MSAALIDQPVRVCELFCHIRYDRQNATEC